MAFAAPSDLVLPPAEVHCKWWKQGYCARGKTCYFRHEEAMAGVDNRKKDAAEPRPNGIDKGKARFSPSLARDGSSPSNASSVASAPAQICTICLETPDTFGLLLNCDHVFCLECIRDWRSSTKAPLASNDELKDTTKTCPLCRAHSDYVIPSSQFPIASSTDPIQTGENTVKKEIVDRYLSRLKNIPCRYFEKSTERSMDSMSNFRPKCRFGNDCHYAHMHPITKEPYIFSEEQMKRGRRIPRQRGSRQNEEMAMMEAMFHAFGHGYDSDDDWGCEDEDLAFFESSPVGFGFSYDLDFEEFDHNYGWDDWSA